MASIAVLGAGGPTGARVIEALGRGPHEIAAGDRTGAAVDADLVVVALRDPRERADALRTASRAGIPAVDAGTDAALALTGGAAPLVLAAGALVGDLLAALVADAVPDAEELHVCWAFPDRGGWRAAVAPGVRAGMTARLAAPLPGAEDEDERAGERRRLAWFPRPVGPVHAAAVPGPEPVTVRRRTPRLREVRTHLAVPTWRAEVLQATANAARTRRLRAVVARRLEQGPTPVGGDAAPRWACVAESTGDPGVVRAWAYGRDVIGTAGEGIALLADRLLATPVAGGVYGPAQVAPADDLLDELSVRCGLRWALSRPTGERGRG
jgi:hypothetical protein